MGNICGLYWDRTSSRYIFLVSTVHLLTTHSYFIAWDIQPMVTNIRKSYSSIIIILSGINGRADKLCVCMLKSSGLNPLCVFCRYQ